MYHEFVGLWAIRRRVRAARARELVMAFAAAFGKGE